MRSAAPSPKKKSSLPLLGGVGLALILIVLMTGGDSPPAARSATARKKASTKGNDLYTEADRTAKFAPFTGTAIDVFNPLVKREVAAPVLPTTNANGPTGGIPASITGGDGNWYYTGLVELNGQREALLENTTTGETTYVSSGETWKNGRVSRVDVSAVVLVGPDGLSVDVPLQQYGETPGATTRVATAPGVAPLAVPSGALSGAIGGSAAAGRPANAGITPLPAAGGPSTATMTLPDGRTIQVPLDPNGVNNTNNQNNNGGRRGRRQRNNSGNNNVP